MWLAEGTNLHISSALVTALVIGIPSLIIAFASYWLSARARKESASSVSRQVDAQAYARAQDLYESAIAELRRERNDLLDEVRRLREQIARRTRRPPSKPVA